MPYITDEDRVDLDTCLDMLFEHFHVIKPGSPGELNYILTKIVSQWLVEKGVSYTHINDVVGVLDCVKAEFYRRVAVPYEEKKRKKNGDVYPEEVLRCEG